MKFCLTKEEKQHLNNIATEGGDVICTVVDCMNVDCFSCPFHCIKDQYEVIGKHLSQLLETFEVTEK